MTVGCSTWQFPPCNGQVFEQELRATPSQYRTGMVDGLERGSVLYYPVCVRGYSPPGFHEVSSLFTRLDRVEETLPHQIQFVTAAANRLHTSTSASYLVYGKPVTRAPRLTG